MPKLNALAEAIRSSPGRSAVVAGLAVALTVTPALFVPTLYDDFTLPKQASLLLATALILVGLAAGGDLFPRDRTLRLLVVAFVGWTAVAWLVGIDPAGGLLGVYQYRQGLLTQLAYVALFVGVLSLAHHVLTEKIILVLGVVGLCPVFLYTVVQAVGADPITWWIDTQDRAIGTIGNANELAAYAVIAMAFATAPLGRGRFRTFVVPFAVSISCWFIVLEAQSRSGIVALLLVHVFALGLPLVCRFGRRNAARLSALIGLGACCAVAMSLAAGGLEGSAGRLQSGARSQDAGGSTRVALIRGTVPTIVASPTWGFGPDGLHLAFPIHRPADLGGAFDSYDLTVQSSHNWLLDTAAGTGLVGLALLLALLTRIGWRSLRAELPGRDPSIVMPWAALLGYGALTLVNPLSLAAHATFFIVLGLVAARGLAVTERTPTVSPGRRRWRFAAAIPVACALIAVAVLLPLADLRADDAWNHEARGEFREAADRYAAASRLVSFERAYASRGAGVLLAAGATGDSGGLAEAESAFRDFDARFGMASGEAVALATVLIGLERSPADISDVIDEALALNPHGVAMAEYTDTLRVAAVSGGSLRYVEADRWVIVEAVR